MEGQNDHSEVFLKEALEKPRKDVKIAVHMDNWMFVFTLNDGELGMLTVRGLLEKMRRSVLQVIERQPWKEVNFSGMSLEQCPKGMSEKEWKDSANFLKELQWPSPFPLFLLQIPKVKMAERPLTMADNDWLGPGLVQYAQSIWKMYENAVRAQGSEPTAYNLSLNATIFLRKLSLPVLENPGVGNIQKESFRIIPLDVVKRTQSAFFLGPNGAGKSTMARRCHSIGEGWEFVLIDARRGQMINGDDPLRNADDPFGIDYVVAKLLEDHKKAKVMGRESIFERLLPVWNQVMGTELKVFEAQDLELHIVKNNRLHFNYHRWSDGERGILVMLFYVFYNSSPSVFIVDEPEAHLHASLLYIFWKEVQQRKLDSIFVFFTHELHWATSFDPRAVFCYLHSSEDVDGCRKFNWEQIDVQVAGPGMEVALSLLGSRALKVVVCEGRDLESHPWDALVYRAVFGDSCTVLPVGGCSVVEDSVRQFVALESQGIGAKARGYEICCVGIVDRDFSFDRDRPLYASANANVFCIATTDIESLLCTPEVITLALLSYGETDNQIAGHLDKIWNLFKQRYCDTVEQVKKQYERYCAEMENYDEVVLKDLTWFSDASDLKTFCCRWKLKSHNPKTKQGGMMDCVAAALGIPKVVYENLIHTLLVTHPFALRDAVLGYMPNGVCQKVL